MMHLVEEMKDASKQAPVCAILSHHHNTANMIYPQRVIVWSMVFCSVTSWLGAILMMYTAGDWESYMSC